MEKLLSTLLSEFKSSLSDTYESIERDIEFPNIPKMISVFIGMRRSGKTYSIYQKIRNLIDQGISINQILFINFEDDRLLPMEQKKLSSLLETFYTLSNVP